MIIDPIREIFRAIREKTQKGMQFILLTLACSFLPTYSAHVLSSRIFIRTIFIAQVKLDRFNRFVNNIVLKTCSPRGSSYAPFLPQQLEFFSSKRNISRFRIPSERGCNVVRGGRRKEEEGKGKEARTLESSLIKPLNFLLCHFFLPFPFLFFSSPPQTYETYLRDSSPPRVFPSICG